MVLETAEAFPVSRHYAVMIGIAHGSNSPCILDLDLRRWSMILSTAEKAFSVLLLRGYMDFRASLGMVAKQDVSYIQRTVHCDIFL
jgi:hypothetical protein